MRKGIAILGGIGIGAGLMYAFDPDRGKRRRALMRDKVSATANKATYTAGKIKRDLRNRAYGLISETKVIFKREDVSDEVLVDRVRSKLGRVLSHPGAIEVTAKDGVVTLSGPLPAREAEELLCNVRRVRGTKEVKNQLEIQQRSPQGQPAAAGH